MEGDGKVGGERGRGDGKVGGEREKKEEERQARS